MEVQPLGPGYAIAIPSLASKCNALCRAIRSFSVGQTSPDGHTNRVFSIKFHPGDSNILVTAGWDKTVQVALFDITHAISDGTLGLGFAATQARSICLRALCCRGYAGY